jgi:hypothetical protein
LAHSHRHRTEAPRELHVHAKIENALVREDEAEHAVLASLAHVQDLLVIGEHQSRRVGQAIQSEGFDDLGVKVDDVYTTTGVLQ